MLTDDKVLKEALDEEMPEIVEQEKITQMYLEQQYIPVDIKA